MPNYTKLVLALGLIVFATATVSVAQSAGIALSETESNPDAPIEITANQLTVDRETGNAIFAGDVYAVRGVLTLNADELQVIYDEETDEDDGIREIIATGNVILVNGPDVAEAERAVYVPSDDTVTMTGNVLLTQERTVISGNLLLVNLVTGQGQMTGQVRTTFSSRNSEASE